MRAAGKRLVPFLLLCAAPAYADTIILKDGSSVPCDAVKEATYDQVVFEVRRSTQRRDAAEVARVVRTGERWLDAALRLLERGQDPQRCEEYLQKVIDSGDAWAKPYAAFFLGELYESHDRLPQATAAYDKVVELDPRHFYAPMALERNIRIFTNANREQDAMQRLDRLASGDFGRGWRDRGSFGKARRLLAAGKHGEAKRTFADLAARGSAEDLRLLAQCGEAHCSVLAGDTRSAERTFRAVSSNASAPPEAKGYAWRGLGDCEAKNGDVDAAMLAYLRSYLLYPSNPEARGAAAAAGQLAAKNGLPGAQRLEALARSPIGLPDFSGGEGASAELMRRTLQNVSAALVQRFAPALIAEANGQEKADLEFLRADAMKAQARATNDADLLAEYEKLLEELQKKYPNNDRSALAGIDAFQAAKDRALALINQAKDEQDEAKKSRLLAEGQKLFEDNIGPFKATIEDLSKQVNDLYEKEAQGGELSEAEEEQRHELEFRRDLAEFLLAEAYVSYANSFDEGSDGRKANLEKALQGYDHYINNRGGNIRFLFYSYVGRGEALLALERFDDAIMQFEELTYVQAPYEPEDPKAKAAIDELVKDVCIRAYYGLTRAYNMAGKGDAGFRASQAIDENSTAKGWEDHPVGILLTFERAKALAGAGRGAEGARELYGIIEEAKRVPEAEKIAGLGMSRIGAGACRALSELSDQTGGEIYSPEVQYHVGIGYFLRRRPELAVAGFKGVLTAARTPEERREWVPKSVKQIGNLLFQQERFLEAALAYETVFTEFPDHELASEAVRFALSAAKKAVEQFGEDLKDDSAPMVAFYRSIERQAIQSDATKAAQLIMNQAADLQKDNRWALAAEKYLEVPAEIKDDDGKVQKVRFYSNAIANAGYCYFQAYRQGKDERHLNAARESLQKASRIAEQENDRDAQALACYYLGSLEVDLERPREALQALAPFDTVLAATTRYIVRARYQQALAHIMLNQIDQAEAAFDKVSGKQDDAYYAPFAYNLGRAFRVRAGDVYEQDPGRIDEARRLRTKAARFINEWFKHENKDSLRDVHYWWAGSVLFAGGLWDDAAALYREGLQRFPRPALNGRKEAHEANEGYDTAEVQLGYALAKAGKAQEAYEVLARLRDAVYITDLSGNAVARGVLKDRVISDRTFTVKREGRTSQRKWWFTVVEVDGQEKRFFDTAEPRGANTEFRGVEGADPTQPYTSADERMIVRPLMRDYYVVDGLAQAAWALWESGKDQNFLANEVTAACNELRYVLRGMSETYYARLAATTQVEPIDFTLRQWSADVQYLRIKMAREQWREVVSDLKQMELLGRLKQAPAEVQRELQEIRRQAEAKQ